MGRHRRRVGLEVLALLVVLVAVSAFASGRPARRLQPPGAESSALRLPGGSLGTLPPSGERRAEALSWRGRPYASRSGELVNVFVSSSYPPDDTTAQRWADFFSGLVHGPELSEVTVDVATPAEVASICGGVEVAGCYGDDRLVIAGEMMDGLSPTFVAMHEYGHHVAYHRSNAPWRAQLWGAKRWASATNVCAGVYAHTLFPGDEYLMYKRNPGEVFAETYRVLNETKAGAATSDWPIVAADLYPTPAALAALERDVVDPWRAPAARTYHPAFRRGQTRSWQSEVPAPLDGELSVTLTMPPAAGYDLSLLAADGHTLLARGVGKDGQRTLGVRICGQRRFVVRVTPHGGRAGGFGVRVTEPAWASDD